MVLELILVLVVPDHSNTTANQVCARPDTTLGTSTDDMEMEIDPSCAPLFFVEIDASMRHSPSFNRSGFDLQRASESQDKRTLWTV